MTAMQHVYLTAHGSWQGGAWLGEAGQFGLRLPVVPVIGAPDKGTIFTPEVNGDVVIDQGQQTGAHGTLTRTWKARMGVVGSDDNWDGAFQVDCAEDVWTFLNAVKANFPTTFAWTHVKQAAVSATGKTIAPSSVYQFTAPLAGTATSTLPPQLAVAISMRAPIIGRRGRGRIYLPGITTGMLATDGTIGTATVNGLLTTFKALVDNLQNPSGVLENIPVVSVMSAGSATAVRPSSLRIGNRFDTIQSRRRQVAEAYTSTDL